MYISELIEDLFEISQDVESDSNVYLKHEELEVELFDVYVRPLWDNKYEIILE